MSTQYLREATVRSVLDGNLVEILIDGKVHVIKLIGSRSPVAWDVLNNKEIESPSPYAKEAKSRLQELLPENSTIYFQLDFDERDQNNHIQAYVYLSDQETMVNAVLISEGLAKSTAEPPNVRFFQDFEMLEVNAKQSGLNIWSEPNEKPLVAQTVSTVTPSPIIPQQNPSKPSTLNYYQRFPQQYFAGANVSIYFGSIHIDEIQDLAFSLQEVVQPIYGYASYTADAFVRGTRLIEGQFTINFKEAYYLKAILEKLKHTDKAKAPEDPFIAFDNVGGGRQNIEEVIKHLDPHDFDTYAKQYQKAIWGIGADRTDIASLSEFKETSPYFDQLDSDGFNIVINYGDIDSSLQNSTTKTIIGVQLTGCSQMLAPTGQPVLEQYSFIAKDLDGFI